MTGLSQSLNSHGASPTDGRQPQRLPLTEQTSFIDRTTVINFRFDGRPYQGYEGDTVASALAANGQFVLSRSFKYHRARGVLTMAGQDANTIVQVPGNPNALADQVRIYEGLDVQPVNVFGSLMRDRGRAINGLSRFLPVGFYYKAFYRPQGAWDYWSKLFRRMTGLGQLDTAYVPSRYDKRYRFFQVVVVGGGVAGMAAACAAADEGQKVLIVEEQRFLGGAMHYEEHHLTDSERTQWHRLRRRTEAHDNIEVMTDSVCNGWFADHWLGVITGQCLHKVRAREVVLATGVLEQPAVFRNNDLPGVLLSSAVQRLIYQYEVRPGNRAVVLTSNENGYAAALDMLNAGVDVTAIADLNHDSASPDVADALKRRGVVVHTDTMIKSAHSNRGQTHVASVEFSAVSDTTTTTARYAVDLVCIAVGFMPAYQLACQAGAVLDYQDHSARFRLQDVPAGLHVAGAINGWFCYENAESDGKRAGLAAASGREQNAELGVEPTRNAVWPIAVHRKGKEFVDLDEDLQVDDLVHSTREGYVDIQLVKRYSTCGMGPSQGRQSALSAARIVARANGHTVAQTGVTTARPPYSAESIAHSAGRRYFPKRQTSLQAEHEAAGATMMQAGMWERPAFYGSLENRDRAIRAEALAVRHGVGMIDVSTLGGLDIRGPDAAELINRLYTGGFLKQPVGRARYALMTDQAGVVIDDGVACRLEAEHFYMTATTSGVDRVYRAMLKWNAQWRLNVDVTNVTSAFSAVNVAGPRSRELMATVCRDIDLAAEAFEYMGVRTGRVAGVAVRILRVGFVGELGYEIHVPTAYARIVWQALVNAGKAYDLSLFGVEAQRVMRLEKGHIIVGQDTDAMTNVLEVQMQWAVNHTKPFFVGGRTLKELEQRGIRRRLVGFALDRNEPHLPKENQLVLSGDTMIGRVTSCAFSPSLERGIGLAYVPFDYDRSQLCIKCDDGVRVIGEVVTTPFYDPENRRQAL